MNTLDYFKLIIIVQIFFGVSVTLLAYSMPSSSYTDMIEAEHQVDLTETGNIITSAAERQTNIPILDVGSLIFFSGNIIIDLVLNSVFAIPEMATSLVSVFNIFLPLDPTVKIYIGISIFLIIGAVYIINILAFIINLRSSASVGGAA